MNKVMQSIKFGLLVFFAVSFLKRNLLRCGLWLYLNIVIPITNNWLLFPIHYKFRNMLARIYNDPNNF